MRGKGAYESLAGQFRQIIALGQVAGLLSWDQETMMPRAGAAMRAEEAAAVEAAIHRLKADPRVGDWLDAIDPARLDPAGAVLWREARKAHDRAIRVPSALAEELARVTALSQGIWARARSANRFADFAPSLSRVIELRREEADHLSEPGQSRYGVLLDSYEPGMRLSELGPLLKALRPRLTALRDRLMGAPAPAALTGTFPAAAQLALSRKAATMLGYDWEAGRLDLAVHPFSSGTGTDARITTRIDEADPLNCLYSTIHETGHACYEQGIDPRLALSPAGRWCSMGVHESQSRLFENQIGRSRAFCEWLWPHLRAELGPVAGLDGPEALYRAVNRVQTGFIRTEADEVHYNLHILLRFELEQALIAGALAVDDLEDAWNAAFLRDFGVAVPSAREGVLQDVHWSVGLFGYFPTYALGNIFAGELDAAMRRDLPDLDTELAAGNARPALDWLRSRVHRHGRLQAPMDLIGAAVGHKPTGAPLLGYLERKFGDLYGI